MKKSVLLPFVVLSLFLWGCGGSRTLLGELDIVEEFTLLDDEGERYTFGRGNLAVTLEIESGNAKLKLRNRVFTFDIPEGTDIPRGNGDFYISAAESGQPYDLSGAVFHRYQERLEYQTSEYCVKRDLVTGSRHVFWYQVSHYSGTTRNRYRIEILAPSRFAPLATFNVETVTIRRWKLPECKAFGW